MSEYPSLGIAVFRIEVFDTTNRHIKSANEFSSWRSLRPTLRPLR